MKDMYLLDYILATRVEKGVKTDVKFNAYEVPNKSGVNDSGDNIKMTYAAVVRSNGSGKYSRYDT